MFKNKKLILMAITTLFLACGPLAMMTSASEGTAFHCSLGMGGRVISETELQLSEDGLSLKYKLRVHDVEDILMAHLHLGKTGELGTPVVWLYPAGPPPRLIAGRFEGVLAQGTITKENLVGSLRGRPLSALITGILAGNVYINLHTRKHIRGEFCGPVKLIEEKKP